MVAAIVMPALSGCAAQREFAGYPDTRSPRVEGARWPRLADGPNHAQPLGPGPDTTSGAAIAAGLAATARVQAEQAARLAGPVVSVDDLRAAAEATRDGSLAP